jgi:hypothetical protein
VTHPSYHSVGLPPRSPAQNRASASGWGVLRTISLIQPMGDPVPCSDMNAASHDRRGTLAPALRTSRGVAAGESGVTFDLMLSWPLLLVALGIWIWALVTLLRTPRAGFASSLERTLMIYVVIFLGLFGALGWLFAVRPLIRSRLLELDEGGARQPVEAWRRHLAP